MNGPIGTMEMASIIEQAPDAFIYTDTKGTIRLWNQRAEEIFGYAKTEVLGHSLDFMIPERMRAAHWRGFNAAAESGRAKYRGRVLTTRSEHKSGRKLYVDLSFALVNDATGTLIGVLAIARDVTERYLEDRALRERLRNIDGGSNSAT